MESAEAAADASARRLLRSSEPRRDVAVRQVLDDPEPHGLAQGGSQVVERAGEAGALRFEVGKRDEPLEILLAERRLLKTEPIESPPLGVPAAVVERELAVRDPVEPRGRLRRVAGPAAPPPGVGLRERLGPQVPSDLDVERPPREEDEQLPGMPIVQPHERGAVEAASGGHAEKLHERAAA